MQMRKTNEIMTDRCKLEEMLILLDAELKKRVVGGV
jgi:hypothetical protein